MLVSLLSSILVTQPLKLLLFALATSFLCGRCAGDDEGDDEDECQLALRPDEEYIQPGPGTQAATLSYLK